MFHTKINWPFTSVFHGYLEYPDAPGDGGPLVLAWHSPIQHIWACPPSSLSCLRLKALNLTALPGRTCPCRFSQRPSWTPATLIFAYVLDCATLPCLASVFISSMWNPLLMTHWFSLAGSLPGTPQLPCPSLGLYPGSRHLAS